MSNDNSNFDTELFGVDILGNILGNLIYAFIYHDPQIQELKKALDMIIEKLDRIENSINKK